MNTGKTLFAQLMDFRHGLLSRGSSTGMAAITGSAEQYLMAFAQLTYRESLRDIETCLSVHASKLYHMGFRQPVSARRWPMPTKSVRRCPAAHHPGEDAVRRRRTGS